MIYLKDYPPSHMTQLFHLFIVNDLWTALIEFKNSIEFNVYVWEIYLINIEIL